MASVVRADAWAVVISCAQSTAPRLPVRSTMIHLLQNKAAQLPGSVELLQTEPEVVDMGHSHHPSPPNKSTVSKLEPNSMRRLTLNGERQGQTGL
jgi:hypothetical protein